MKLSANRPAIQAILNNERIRERLHEYVSEVRADEMERLATAITTEGDMRYMQGRISVFSELLALLTQDKR